ncbi:MAG: ThiF family adenylyltransferase [Nanoarchaeota archaeon]|nr:ThiF family adenylyltransferase [Nanoarchaeota archaeon]
MNLSVDEYYKKAFLRNIGLFSQKEQKKLRNFTIAIAGMGGVGGIHALTLARMGIGNFHIADSDNFEIVNINRQIGANVSSFGKSKVKTIEKMIKDINPFAKVKVINEKINEKNIDLFLKDVDIFIDGIDFFCIEARRLIFKKAKEKGIYVITAGPVGFGAPWLIFAPNKMSFDEYFDINDKMSFDEKIIAFGLGLAPGGLQLKYMDIKRVNIHEKKGPSSVIACNLCSAIVACEAIKILLKKEKVLVVPHYMQFDLRRLKFKKGYMPFGNKNPIQKFKRWYAKKILKKYNKI